MPNETILVVEDESIVAKDIQNTLRFFGYHVPHTAGTGLDALRLAREIRPTLILMDINLRGDMDGIQTATAIQSQQQIPIIYLTAYADEETLARAKITAPYGYLIKPFEERELGIAVEMAIHRSQLEAQSLRNEQRFRSVFEGAADAIFVHELEGRFVDANRFACDSLGYTHDELMQLSLGDVESNFEPGRMKERWNARPNDWPLTVIGTQTRKDGSTFPVEVRISPFQSDNNLSGETTVLMLAIARDLSERERAQRQVEGSRARLSGVVETNADAITIIEPDGHISFANSSSRRIFGLEQAAILGRTYHDSRWEFLALDGSPLPESALPFARVLQSQAPVSDVEYSLLRPDGRRIIVSVNASPLFETQIQHNQAVQVLAGVVCCASDITRRKALEERLTHQAMHDVLTGLPNRALFSNRLEQALARANRSHNEVAVLFLDLDNFKFINDSLGHGVGDRLLIAVAGRLESCLRATDTAARFGGDEFVILLDDVSNPNYAMRVVERIMAAMQKPFELEGRETFALPSIGIAFSRASDNEPPEHPNELLRNADAAMYAAKAKGKGCYQVFQDTMSQAAIVRLELEADLRRALERDELRLQYQPKVHLESGLIYGVEALVRWQHPKRGLVPPLDFIPLAEETGLIVPIGLWVLEQACAQAKMWQISNPQAPPVLMSINVSGRQMQGAQNPASSDVSEASDSNSEQKFPPVAPPLELNVNLSVRQLHHPGIVQDVARALQESGLDARSLILEITENVLIEETHGTAHVLQQLKDLGVQIAIDDFGTGYSSLAYLNSFPLDILKIDRRFISNLHEEGGSGVIVSSMINLAHALNLTVVAEGTESLGEVERLQQLGCDVAQGYYFARPMDGSEIENWIAQSQTPTTPDA